MTMCELGICKQTTQHHPSLRLTKIAKKKTQPPAPSSKRSTTTRRRNPTQPLAMWLDGVGAGFRLEALKHQQTRWVRVMSKR